MIVLTTECMDGLKPIGNVSASSVLSRNVFKDVSAGIKAIRGGVVGEYEELLEDSNERAVQKLKDKAHRIGATHIIGLRFVTTDVAGGSSEWTAYGTACVKV